MFNRHWTGCKVQTKSPVVNAAAIVAVSRIGLFQFIRVEDLESIRHTVLGLLVAFVSDRRCALFNHFWIAVLLDIGPYVTLRGKAKLASCPLLTNDIVIAKHIDRIIV